MSEKKQTIPKDVKEAYDNLLQDEKVQNALKFIEEDHDKTVSDQIEIAEIPAPPFKEEKRAKYYMERLKALQLDDVQMDEEGNVYGIRRGSGEGPTIFVSAHLDTVFPEGTDTTVTEKDGILYGPGIADDTRGLTELLAVVRAFNELNIETVGDIIFGGTVGEEGAGDLRGVKAFFNEHDDIDGFISLDGADPQRIVYLGTGSYRYTVTYKGPGGHSFGAFGLPSAIHALGRAIAGISDLQTKSDPKTTFTVGQVWGGTSVNAIAGEASMNVDLRSNDQQELDHLKEKFLQIVKEAAEEENKRWDSDQITFHLEKFGNRPPASQSPDDRIVEVAKGGIAALDIEPILADASSTDSNYPMSLGIPSVTLGLGGKSGGAHSLDEWYDPTDGHIGVQTSFLSILALVGMKDVQDPML